mmetsp:Transcript_17390/g.36758  ORF Transcript_17390/g.36758 Transcript_17390/m.36758 type:complete len:221 (+) Transcript_17390:6671-7333(+)
MQYLELHLSLVGEPRLVKEDQAARPRAKPLVLALSLQCAQQDALHLGARREIRALVEERVDCVELPAKVAGGVLPAQVVTDHVKAQRLGAARRPDQPKRYPRAEAGDHGENVLFERLVQRDARRDLKVLWGDEAVQLVAHKVTESEHSLLFQSRQETIHQGLKARPSARVASTSARVARPLVIQTFWKSEVIDQGDRGSHSSFQNLERINAAGYAGCLPL